MKIGKTLLTVLFLGLIAIGGGLLYMLWQDELDRGVVTLKDMQSANLDTTQALLPLAQDSVTEAEAELEAAEAALAAAEEQLAEYIDLFPAPPPQAAIQTIDYGEKLFNLTANNSIDLIEFRGGDYGLITLDNIRYQRTTLNLRVTGPIENINDFIGNLETTEPYLTASIDSVNIEIFNEYDEGIAGIPDPEARIAITILALER